MKYYQDGLQTLTTHYKALLVIVIECLRKEHQYVWLVRHQVGIHVAVVYLTV